MFPPLRPTNVASRGMGDLSHSCFRLGTGTCPYRAAPARAASVRRGLARLPPHDPLIELIHSPPVTAA
jgi:hypothetical protein